MCTSCSTELARDLMAAFPMLVAHHQDLVYGIARRSTRDHDDAQDLAQEAFLRAYRALSGYDRERTAALRLRGWLGRITLNLARNRARDGAPATADIEAVPEPVDQGAPAPEQVVESRESAAMWRRRLDGLPHAHRLAVELRHVDGLSYPELAEALGKPIGTVKSDVHRGVLALQRMYRAEGASGSNGDARPAGGRSVTAGKPAPAGETGSNDGVEAGSRMAAGPLPPEVMIR